MRMRRVVQRPAAQYRHEQQRAGHPGQVDDADHIEYRPAEQNRHDETERSPQPQAAVPLEIRADALQDQGSPTGTMPKLKKLSTMSTAKTAGGSRTTNKGRKAASEITAIVLSTRARLVA